MTAAKRISIGLIALLFIVCSWDSAHAITFVPSPCPTSTDLFRAAANSVDSRLQDTTANDSTKKVFSTTGDITGGWVRSSTVWTASSTDIDWSGVSPLNTIYGLSATLITPRHFVTAYHAGVPVGAVMLFVAPDNSVATRTVTALQRQVGGGDIDIGILDSAVPSNITHYPILSTSTLESYMRDGVDENSYSLPIIVFDNEEKALVKVTTKQNLYSTQAVQIGHQPASAGNRLAFDETLIGGDSAHPVFIMVGNKPVLVGTHTTAYGAAFYGRYRSDVETAIDALGGGYDLSGISLSCFNAPIVLNENASLPYLAEGSSNGTSVGSIGVEYNVESNTPYYTFASGNSDSAFAIDSSSGAITVADSSKIDVDNSFPRTLVIKAEETAPGGRASYATTTISLSAYPRFTASSYQFSLDENTANGTSIGTIGATDAEGNTLAYSITSGNSSGALSINPSTGALSVADSSILDYESTTTIALIVKVQEVGTVDLLSATTPVTVSLNDLSTRFDQLAYTFSLSEGASQGASVGTISASIIDDDNSGIYYSITAGNSAGIFAINSTTGVITTVDPSLLNYDSTSSYALTVGVAENSSSPVLTTVPVTVSITTASRPTISFDSSSTYVYEGTTESLSVELSAAYARDVTVSYTTSDGSAVSSSDYTTSSGTLTIPAGSTSGTIQVVILADSSSEGNETLSVTLSSPSKASLGFQSTHTIVIRNGAGSSSSGSTGGGSSGGGGGLSSSVRTTVVPVVTSLSSPEFRPLDCPTGYICAPVNVQSRSQTSVQTTVSQASQGSVTSLASKPLTRSLVSGSTGEDARTLQKLLNAKGYTVSATGPGSPGLETTYFGPLTTQAVQKLQCATLSICSGTPSTTGYGYVGPRTRGVVTR